MLGGARVEREREGAVVVELDVLAGVDQLEAAAPAGLRPRPPLRRSRDPASGELV
jgi:hypothetical protein